MRLPLPEDFYALDSLPAVLSGNLLKNGQLTLRKPGQTGQQANRPVSSPTWRFASAMLGF